MRALAACLSLLLVGCAPSRVPGLAFALPVADDPAAPAPLQVEPAREMTESVRNGSVRIMGVARLPQAVPAANVSPDGSVAGSPVTVTDVMTGRRAGMATTFYDGSFYVDVPLAQGQRAVLVTLDLVDRRTSDRRATLATTALLKAGEVEHAVHVGLGTTVLSTVMNDVATLQAGRTLPEAMLVLPPGGSRELGSLIANFKPDDLPKFEALVSGAPELTGPSSVEELAAGLRRYAGKLRASARQKAL